MQPTRYIFAQRRPKPATTTTAQPPRAGNPSRSDGQDARQRRSEPFGDHTQDRPRRTGEPRDGRRAAEGQRAERQRPESDRPRFDAAARAGGTRQERSRADGSGRSDAPWSDRASAPRRDRTGGQAPAAPSRGGAYPTGPQNRLGGARSRPIGQQARPQPRPAPPQYQETRPAAPSVAAPEVRFREVPASAELTSFAELAAAPGDARGRRRDGHQRADPDPVPGDPGHAGRRGRRRAGPDGLGQDAGLQPADRRADRPVDPGRPGAGAGPNPRAGDPGGRRDREAGARPAA